jgi:hypothetical protein
MIVAIMGRISDAVVAGGAVLSSTQRPNTQTLPAQCGGRSRSFRPRFPPRRPFGRPAGKRLLGRSRKGSRPYPGSGGQTAGPSLIRSSANHAISMARRASPQPGLKESAPGQKRKCFKLMKASCADDGSVCL